MQTNATIAILVLIFPFLAAMGMIWFMMSGKGKPAPTQDEIVAAKKKLQEKNQEEE